MKITELSGGNIKGTTFNMTCSPINLIVGPNFAGKTTVLDTLQLALCGFHPRMKKTNPEIFGLSSGVEMEALARFDNGAAIHRVWAKSKNTVTAKTVGIGGITDEWSVPAWHLDGRDFFGLSDRERVDHIFSVCRVDLPNGASEIISALKGLDLSPRTAYGTQFLNEIIEEIQTADQARKETHQTLAEFIDALHADLKKRKLAADASKRAASNVILGVRQEPSNLPDPSDELAQARNVALNKRAEMMEANKALQKARTTEADRQKALAVAQETNWQERLTTCQEEKEKLAQEAKRCEEAHSIASMTRSSFQVPLAGEAAAPLSGLRLSIAEAEKAYEGLKAARCCPTCGAKGKGWKEKAERSFVDFLKNARKELEAAEKVQDAAARTLAELVEIETVAKVKLERARSDLAIADARLQEAAKNSELVKALSAPTQNVGDLEAGYMAAKEASDVAEANVVRLSGLLSEWMKRKAAQEIAVRAEAEAMEKHVESSVLNAAFNAVTAIREKVVYQAFGHLLQTANLIAGDMLRNPLVYRDGTVGYWRQMVKPSGEVEEIFVPMSAFTGTEEAIAFVSVAFALASSTKGGPRILILDELGRFDSRNKGRLLEVMNSLVLECRLDQVFLIDVDDSWVKLVGEEVLPNLQRLDLGGTEKGL